jgi:hypothetical protein
VWKPDAMGDVTDARATSDGLVRCHFCGGSPVLNRAAGDGPSGTGVCRDCAVKLTKNFTDIVAESTGIDGQPLGSTESTLGETALWGGFDAAFSRMSMRRRFESQIADAEKSIDRSWKAT